MWSGGWVVGSLGNLHHFVAPSCKLRLARFSARLKLQDRAECGNSGHLVDLGAGLCMHSNRTNLQSNKLSQVVAHPPLLVVQPISPVESPILPGCATHKN